MKAQNQKPIGWCNTLDFETDTPIVISNFDKNEGHLSADVCTIPLYTSPQSTAQNREPKHIITKDENGLTLHVGWDDLPVGTKLYTSPQSTAEPSQWEVDFNEVLRERDEALAKIAEHRKMMEAALDYTIKYPSGGGLIGISERAKLMDVLRKALA